MTSDKLKPCPFCGGGGIPIEVFNGAYTVRCGKCGVSCPDGTLYGRYSEAEAIEAWNTRYERTCKMEVFSMHDEGDFTFRCSECGKGYVEYEPPRYCPHCGARVVEE